MSRPSNELKTILWAAAVAVFMSGPVYALVITRFDGTFNRNLDRLKIKFRSKFEWMDLDGKMRHGRFNFQSRFDNMQPAL